MTIDTPQLSRMANSLRMLSIDMVNAANSGHPGMPMGMADIMAVLYRNFLQFDPKQPQWLGRDRLVLSNGHGSALLYSGLHLAGYDLPMEEIKNFRQLNSKTPGHPEFGHTVGVETTTGPLGQGLANGVGLALAAKMAKARFGGNHFDHKVYVTAGDGCLMEGISHEACDFAGHMKLNNLIVLFDDNDITIDGRASLATSTDITARFESYGFNVISANGHDFAEIHSALTQAQQSEKPVLIRFKTIIGHGSPNKQDTSGAHGSPLGAEERALVAAELQWPHAPFEIPADIYADWQQAASRTPATPASAEIEAFFNAEIAPAATEALQDLCNSNARAIATRKAGGQCIDALMRSTALPQFISGSADLTGSNLTKSGDMKPISANDFSGNYIFYGIREHAMGAIMNGLRLYGANGGFIPAGGTFLSFLDYMRPPVRLAAMMGLQNIFIFTHDSIGLGEDGPTHQPVEHLAMLRATPNLHTFRPCDLNETACCWALALAHTQTPSAMILSRQELPQISQSTVHHNLCANGAYILQNHSKDLPHAATIIATGSEVEIALTAQKMLSEKGIGARVVSMPCMELFLAQDENYRHETIGTPDHVIGIEAAGKMGWHDVLGANGHFIGMGGYGASAPAEALYDHFNITPQAVVDHVLKK